MRRALFGIVVILLTMTLSAWAQATQPCIVKQYNQKQPKTPLAGVEVMASNAGSTVSATDGSLTLSFRTLKPGDKVNLISAKKAGYEIFNTEAVAQWNISRNSTPFTLVLVKSEYMAQLKGNLTQSSTESYKAKYEKAVRDLERQKKEGKLKEDEYNRRYDELDASYQEQLKNLDNYIDQFARIDLSEVSAEEQRILELVEEGKIDEAVKAYEELDLSGKLRQARENKKALSEAKERIEKEEALQDEAIKDLKAKQEREIATLKLAGGKENYDKIGRMLKENALADTTDYDAAFEYACFACEQNNIQDAELFFRICLHDTTNSYNRFSAYYILGTIFFNKQDYEKAELLLQIGIKVFEPLHEQEKAEPFFQECLAMCQNDFGKLHMAKHEYSKAEEYFIKALDNKTQLFQLDSSLYRGDLASTQYSLGNFYKIQKDYSKSEEYYLKSLKNLNILFMQDSNSFCRRLATTQNALGNLYTILKDYNKSEVYYFMAKKNAEYLFNHNPDANRELFALIQNNLGVLYQIISEYEKSEKYLLSALNNRKTLFDQNPNIYRSDLAETQYDLIKVYSKDTTHSEDLDTLLHDALTNYEILFQNDEQYLSILAELRTAYGTLLLKKRSTAEALLLLESSDSLIPGNNYHTLAMAYTARGTEYYKEQDTVNGLKCIGKALLYYTLLENHKPEIYHEKTNEIRDYLWTMYDFSAIERFYLEEEKAYYSIYPQNTEVYGAILSCIQEILGDIYYSFDDIQNTEKYYLKEIDTYTQLCQNNPEKYENLAKKQNKMGYFYRDDLKNHEKARHFFQNALGCYNTMLQQSGDKKYYVNIAEDHYYIGHTFWLEDNIHNAENHYLEALKNFSQASNFTDIEKKQIADIHFKLGYLYDKTKDYAKAEEYYLKTLEKYKELVESEPEENRRSIATTLSRLIVLYENRQDYTKTEEYYLKALENYTQLFNKNPDAYRASLALTQMRLADMYDVTKDYTLAEQYYLQALENYKVLFRDKPDNYRARLAWIQYSLMYIYAKDDTKLEQYDSMFDAALANYEVLFQNDDSYLHYIVSLRNRKGWRFLQEGETDEALSLFESTYQLDPGESAPYLTSGYNTKAYEYAKAGNFDKALETIDKAISINPEEANLYDSKGEFLLMKGDEEGALRMWQKVLELEPDFLKNHDGSTELYKQLKEKGLIQ